MAMTTKLTRSIDDRLVTGVCGGLSRYLGVDATLVRLAFGLLMIASGLGLWLYIGLALGIPREDWPPDMPLGKVVSANVEAYLARLRGNGGQGMDSAVVLIGLGVLFLLWELHWLSLGTAGALMMVGVGVYLLMKRR